MTTKELHLMPSEIDLSTTKSFPKIKFEKKTTQPKTNKDTNETEAPQSYNTATIIYKHLNPTTNKYEKQERWLVQAPVMKSRGGLVAAKKNGRWGCYVVCSNLDLKIEGMKEFLGQSLELDDWLDMPDKSTKDALGKNDVGFLQNLYMRCSEQAYEDRDSLGLTAAKKPNMMGAVFKNPVKWPTDSRGDVIPGASPTILLKVFLMGDPSKKNTRKAIFSIPAPGTKTGEQVLPWEFLQEAEIEFEPLIQIKSVYAGGGKASLQMEIISAIVHSFVRLNTRGEQTELIEKYSGNEELTRKLMDQMQQMQDLLGDTSLLIPANKDDSKKNKTDDSDKKEKKKLPPPKKDDEDDEPKKDKKKLLPPKKQDDDESELETPRPKKEKPKLLPPKKQDDDESELETPRPKKEKNKKPPSPTPSEAESVIETPVPAPKKEKKKISAENIEPSSPPKKEKKKHESEEDLESETPKPKSKKKVEPVEESDELE